MEMKTDEVRYGYVDQKAEGGALTLSLHCLLLAA